MEQELVQQEIDDLDTRINNFWNEKNTSKYQEAIGEVISYIKEIDEDYYEQKGYHLIRFIEHRLKSAESIKGKYLRKKKKQTYNIEEDINDLAGVRVICYDLEQIYVMVNFLKSSDELEILKVKNYIEKAKDNGYQSYHLIVKINGVKVEIQIRTILMDAWSSLEGILIYKKNRPVSKEIKADIDKFSRWSIRMDKIVHRLLKNQTKNGKNKK